MANDNKSAETREEVVSFFRRALGEVVDFTEESGNTQKNSEKQSLPKPSAEVKPKEVKMPEPETEPKTEPESAKETAKEPVPPKRPERQFVSRRERKEAESAKTAEPAPRELERPAVRRPEPVRQIRRDKGDNSFKKKLIAIAAVVCISVVTACSFFGGDEPAPKVVDDTPIYIRIPLGMGVAGIGEMLEEKQIISSQKYFLKRLRQTGRDGDVQSGTYKVHKGMKSDEVIDILVNGRVAALRFTIPEGYNISEMAKSLEKEGICKSADFIKATKEYKGLSYVKRSADIENPMEGYLFPDTYEVPPDATAEDIVKLMAETFDEQLSDDMRAAAKKYGLSVHEFVTLASLIEKEVMDDEDRPKVAQVFLKRLEIEMPIQSCATIQYLLKEPKEDLTFEDLKIDSPYNTYENPGLPPGPIASPGEKALEAAAHPSATKYLYFVADRKGKTYYSETFDEHMEKVEKYR
ncbi:MAG: endolytic transglycosylase MltG [Selenomonadaceae bacterium]|nr:endolytic transglycosylase MltG [Selenomonadaceae bacterium]